MVNSIVEIKKHLTKLVTIKELRKALYTFPCATIILHVCRLIPGVSMQCIDSSRDIPQFVQSGTINGLIILDCSFDC